MREIQPLQANQHKSIEYLQRCLFLSLLTITFNLFLGIPLVGDAEIHLASIFVLVALVTLPSKYATAVLIASLVSHFYAGHGWAYLVVHTLEIVCISFAIRRHLFLMFASIVYWLFLGMPFLWIVAYFGMSHFQEAALLIATQEGLNGVLAASVASLVLSVLPKRYKLDEFKAKEHRLSSNIFVTCASLILVPTLLISFIYISVSSNENEALLADKIESNSDYVTQLTEAFISEHRLIVEHHARLISDSTPLKHVHASMLQSQRDYPAFFNITTTDKTGRLLFFAPEKFNAEIARLPDEMKTVADRNYFINARNTGEVQISNTLLSRGVVMAPMVSIAAPVFKDGEFDGVVFGAINLDVIRNFKNRIERLLDGDLVIITDSANLTIFASSVIETEPLSVFIPMPSYNYIISELPVLLYEGKHYAYKKQQSAYGWQIYVLTESSSLTTSIRHHFVMAGLSLMVILAVFLLFADRLSKRLSAPLMNLLEATEDGGDLNSQYYNSKEFSDVANKLKRSQFLMRNFENRLKQQVTEKTEQLEQLNLQLAAQAREDGMTHLLNRSGFDEMAINAVKTSYRLGQPFSLALLDIDHFKRINDTYGHLFGDKCLQAFSALMQRNCKRETDIIGRYGGEEFIIFMAGNKVHSHHQLVQNIHQQTRGIKLRPADSEDTVSFTVSVGICSVLGNVNLSLKDIVKLADEELYKSKRGGRNKISLVTVGYTDDEL
ncbi:diguanylate cyclase [Ningiella sp. W23]|uniref:diguanylate cyclase n=1 Tax=Ningiella sp. W23 TaxID=3023715 RepID=UPI00375773D6